MKAVLVDGSLGEGGGQILRTSLALAALTGRPVEVAHIRAGRRKPGLRPQHLTAVRALAGICAAQLRGDALNSQWLSFQPGERPAGGGELSMRVEPIDRLLGRAWVERGELAQVTGVAAVTNLPAHIPQRMADRARNLFQAAGIASRIEPLRARGPAPGAGIFLTAHYACGPAGFSALGRRGLPAEKVAEEACESLLAHHGDERAAVEPHLADQLLLPLALAAGDSALTTSRITEHTLTNIHVLRQFLDARIEIERFGDGGRIEIKGIGYHV